MEAFHPEFLILEHLPFGEAHQRLHVAADEGALIVGDLIGIHDAGRYREQVL